MEKKGLIPFRFLWLFALAAIVPGISRAELKIDFNASNRPLSETWDTAYTPWSTNNIWFFGGDSITNTFDGVTYTFTRRGPEGTGLATDRYATGLTGVGFNAKLVNDGISVAPVGFMGGNGGQIEMRISGLPAGPHTLLSYHNTWQNPATHSFAPLNISMNGVMIITNMPVSNRVTNNSDASFAYIEFNAVDGQDMVFLFQADTNNSATDKNVCIDGFEIDTPNVKFKAFKPTPENNDEHVDADATHNVLLVWNKAAVAVSHNVYYGTSSNAVRNATLASPEFKGNQVATNLMVTNISTLSVNYWRIDEVDATNGVTKGDLWMFRTRHLAFAGAEGYGRFARGGRNGVVVEVSNTNDSGPGSLRDALTGNYGPRTVVFTVSGLITLESDLIINQNNKYITLAGQTAPGKGICTRKYQLGMSGGRDTIIRNVRSRPGNIAGVTLNGSGMSGSDHCIMDHCSISWGIDEEMSTRTAKNLTMQRTLISEALNISGHDHYPPGTRHGFAASIGGDIATFHHNLLAHNEGRNWSLAGGLDPNGFYAGRLDIFNNVVYNWGGRTTDGGAHECNFVANYYKPGAASTYFFALNAQYGGFPGSQQYYFTNNVMPGHFDESNQAAGRTVSTENGGFLPTNYNSFVSAAFFQSYATIHSATRAYKLVLSDVGCNQPMIDDHDVRVIRETIDGTYTYTGTGPYGGSPGLPNSQDDVGGWEDYPFVQRPVNYDTDHDGLPDWWEQIKGLNLNSPTNDFSDSNGDPDGDEYTNLEDYLNWMAALHFDCPTNTSIDLDLTRFTRGFTNNSPVYTVSAAANGSVTLISGKVARFTPAVSTNALGSFTFTVTDAQGDSMTNSVGIHIVSAPPQPPVLGIRNQAGTLLVELTGENGRNLTVQRTTNLVVPWLNWTNVTGIGAMQLLPVEGITNQSQFFRAFAQ
jgi:hypothetical protein